MSEFQNPQHEPGTEKRLILVFALTFIIIVLSQQFLFKKPAPQPQKQEQQQQAAQPAAAQPAVTSPATPAPAPASAAGKGSAVSSTLGKQATQEEETVVENDLYRITFTNRGGQVKSWILKKYTDDKGRQLELIHPHAGQLGLPLSLWTYDEALRTKLNSILYVPSATGQVTAPSEISFEYSDGDLTVRKTFRFDHSYVINVDVGVVRDGKYLTVFTAWPGGFGDQTVPASYNSQRIDYETSEKTIRLAAKKVSGGGTITGPFYWAGTLDQYFAAIFLPDEPQNAAMVTLRNTIQIPKDLNKPNPNETMPETVLGAAVGNLKGHISQRMFVGPMDIDLLDQVHAVSATGKQDGPDLRSVVDFGIFSFIAKPLFLWLKWTYHHMVANWGWAIVILTIIINIALLPLRVMSMRSALKMQRVAPQIKAVQEKYKKYEMRDPRRAEMQTEVAALYKQHNVNPAGGCVPMLIQMPFLFAFYAMLGVAIELRHANWLWVHDLAAPDRMLILPIGIMVTTLLVQKMTPQAGMDPAQQKMMTFMMPVFLGFMSYSLASGLSLYWTVGNLVAIIQQYVMNRTELGREMRAAAAKQARKSKEAKK